MLDLDFPKRPGVHFSLGVQRFFPCFQAGSFSEPEFDRKMRMMGNLGGSYADSKLAQAWFAAMEV